MACSLILAGSAGSFARDAAVIGPLAPTTQVQSPASGTGAISGTVLDAATGQPVSGAVVTLADAALARNATLPGGAQLTDRRGRFVFVDLRPSSMYYVTAAAAGFLDDAGGRDIGRGAIVLAPGQWVQDVSLALTPAGSINGVALDEAGEPVVGAYVRLLSRVAVAGSSHLAAGAITQTDDRGAYSLGGLAAGTYFVVMPSVQVSVPGAMGAAEIAGITPEAAAARAARGSAPPIPVERALDFDPRARLVIGNHPTAPIRSRPVAYPITFHPGGSSLDSAIPVTLGAGEQRDGVDLRLAPVQAARVSGMASGPPEALAKLTLRLMPEALEDLGWGSEAATARVNTDGSFVFLNVPAGTYVLMAPASLAEYQTYPMLRSLRLPAGPGGFNAESIPAAPRNTSFTVGSSPAEGATPYWGRMRLSVGAGDVDDVSLALRPGATLSGRIVTDPAPGGPAWPEGTRLAVGAEAADGDPSLGYPRQVFSRDGPRDEFFIGDMVTGEYLLRASSGTSAWIIKSILYDGREYSDVPFDTSARSDVTGVVVTFTNRGASIQGQVAAGAQPSVLPAVTVVVFPVDESGWTRYGRRPTRIRSMLAASDGTFRFEPLPAGDYYVAAVASADALVWQSPGFFAGARASASRVSVDWGGHATASPKVIGVVR